VEKILTKKSARITNWGAYGGKKSSPGLEKEQRKRIPMGGEEKRKNTEREERNQPHSDHYQRNEVMHKRPQAAE